MNKQAFACVLCIKFYFLYVLYILKNFGFGDIAKNICLEKKKDFDFFLKSKRYSAIFDGLKYLTLTNLKF